MHQSSSEIRNYGVLETVLGTLGLNISPGSCDGREGWCIFVAVKHGVTLIIQEDTLKLRVGQIFISRGLWFGFEIQKRFYTLGIIRIEDDC